jgi:DNA-binding response OmpR family regulator
VNLLLAEDDPVAALSLVRQLEAWSYHVDWVEEGLDAWDRLRRPDAPPMALLDWMMPGLDGPEICRRLRATPSPASTYLILLSARSEQADVVAGLRCGADDYLTKPFDPDELQARLAIGQRTIELQRRLAERVAQLEQAAAEIKLLQAFLPICCYCKKIRDDQNFWQQVDAYLAEHSNLEFERAVCPDCSQRLCASSPPS